jgi:hypothetical protein
MYASLLNDVNSADIEIVAGKNHVYFDDIDKFLQALNLALCNTGGKVFLAHKQILACASPVFYTMLTSEMEEGKTARIVIKAEIDSVEMFKRYLYTQDASVAREASSIQLSELYRLLHLYEIGSLLKSCSKEMARRIAHISHVDNLMQFSIIARIYNDTDLMDSCVRFIDRHSFDLMCNEDWMWFMTQYPWIFQELNKSTSKLNNDEIRLLLIDADGPPTPCSIKELRAAEPNTGHLLSRLAARDHELHICEKEIGSCRIELLACRKELEACKKQLKRRRAALAAKAAKCHTKKDPDSGETRP